MRIRLYFFIFLLMAFLSYASTINSNELSGKNYYTGASTLFVKDFSNYNVYSTTVDGYMSQIPLVYDFGNMGNKIIIPKSDSLYIYNNYDLLDTSLMQVLTPPNQVKTEKVKAYRFANNDYIVVASIDSDDRAKFYRYLYNSTEGNFSYLGNITVRASCNLEVASPRAIAFSCDESTNYCYYALYQRSSSGVNVGKFNITKSQSDTDDDCSRVYFENYGNDDVNGKLCYPTGEPLIISDINNDNINEVIISAIAYKLDTGYYKPEYAIAVWHPIGTLGTPVATKKYYISAGIGPFETGLSQSAFATCEHISGLWAAPIQGNFISGGNGKEIAMGWADTSNSFKIGTFKYQISTNAFIKYHDHPTDIEHFLDIGNDGTRLSNTVRLKAFTYDNLDNYCAMSFTEHNATVLMCATDFNAPFGDYAERTYITYNNTNFYEVKTNNSRLIYSIKGISSNNRDGILTPFGIYSLNNTFNLINSRSWLDKQYSFVEQTGQLSPSNFKGTANLDIFLTSMTNVFYYDDKKTNNNAQVDSYCIDPCTPIKNDSLISVSFTGKDNEGDNVRAVAYAYYGSIYQQNGTMTAYSTSGSNFQFTFNSSILGNNFIIRMQVQDTEHNSTFDTIDYPFSVTGIGYSFGSCQACKNDIISEKMAQQAAQAAIAATNITNTDNSLKNGLGRFAALLQIPPFILFLIALIIIDILIFGASLTSAKLAEHVGTIYLGILFINLLIIILVTFLGIISPAFLITVMLLIIVFIGIYLSKFFNKSQG